MEQGSKSEIHRELGHGKIYGDDPFSRPEAFVVVRTGIYKPVVETDLDQWEFGMFAWPTADVSS